MKIKNPHRFWTGIGIIGLEFLGLGVWGLSKLDWSWATIELLKVSFLGLFVVLTNMFAIGLIFDGSESSK